jgi:putative ABC transport system permease protein
MIRVQNLNKYFNRHRNNEIHVINDTSLEFPQKGLVCLLGASGSGKTTLLNVIGGLDNVDSGEIVFNHQILRRYRANQWDKLRNRHFGYIFQNYHLLPELTVYENLEFVLKMFNLTKEEIDQRIEYALNAVGMFRFRKRRPFQLSGGQQQRVAIARALVKSPDVVIADEPTGNLDEKNTTQIMNIIKKISRECLVILVTHEKRLAEFYGDYIIEIVDGSIVGQTVAVQSLRHFHTDDRNIYLPEFQVEEYREQDLAIKYFYDRERPPLDLSIIYKDGMFYLSSSTDKVKFIDNNSEIKIIDAPKPVIDSNSIEDFDYYLPPMASKAQEKRSVIGLKNCLKLAFSHLKRLRKRQKLLFIVFLFSVIMVVIGFINLFTALTVSEPDFLYFNRELLHIYDHDFDEFSDLEDLKTQSGAKYLLVFPPKNNTEFVDIDIFAQNSRSVPIIPLSSAVPLGIVKNPERKLILGRLPENDGEIVIDKYLADELLKDANFRSSGVKYYEQFIGIRFSPAFADLKIVGIINNNNPNFYLTDQGYQLYHVSLAHSSRMQIFTPEVTGLFYLLDDYQLNDLDATPHELSSISLGPDEIIVSHFAWQLIESGILRVYGADDLRVVGVHELGNSILISQSAVNDLYRSELLKAFEFTIYATQKARTLEKLREMGLSAQDLYQYEYDNKYALTFNLQIYIFAIVILIASCIFLYFLMRSSLFSRIYTIGIYRALGVRKAEIYKIFLTEILAITLLTGIAGVLAVSWIVGEVNSIYAFIFYPWYIPVISFVFVLCVNIFVGLLPVFSLMRLTPSQILSKYDI